jgi:hypothetical protein
MQTLTPVQLRARIRTLLIFFIVGLVLSGLTAYPVETELAFVVEHLNYIPAFLHTWLSETYRAIQETNAKYPFISYGSDWLAFAHLVIAVAFIGPLRDPVRNIWVVQFGMIACCMVFPNAFIMGPIRQIPFYWQLIDCSFGLFGFIPLWLCYRYIRQLETMTNAN